MLCSGSSWLDRLRSNKGFPAGDNNLDLDHFLSRQQPNSELQTPNVVSAPPNNVRDSNVSESESPLMSLMSTAVSELFFIDGAGESSGKKMPRKQTRPPRVCCVSEEKRWGNDEKALAAAAEEERELRGYSRSEVTVIDTSEATWKTEKVVFRRRSVWKVRDKKTKLRSFNKRKLLLADEEHKNKEKRAEVSVSDHDDDDDAGDQCISLNPVENTVYDTRNEIFIDTRDNRNNRGEDLGKDLEKRFPLNRLPRKTIKDDSAVVIIKGISTDEKIEGKPPKKYLKDQKIYKV